MFTPIFMLPGADDNDLWKRVADRWDAYENRDQAKEIFDKIRAGGGEDFLQWEYEQRKFPMLEDYTDLRGIKFFKEDITFPANTDNFEAIDFGFAEFWHTNFKNACFSSSHFKFARLYNTEFRECTLGFTHYFGCSFDRVRFIDCEFREKNTFTNCDFKSVSFAGCAFSERAFFDCRFDEQTKVGMPTARRNTKLEKKLEASFFRGVRESYEAGDVSDAADDYFLAERMSITRNNTDDLLPKVRGYFVEALAGYGVRPVRVLLSMLVVLAAFSVAFALKFGTNKGLMLSSGAFLTFGAETNLLNDAALPWKITYITESFLGVALMATFITVLARKAFRV